MSFADCNAAAMLGALMTGLGRTGRVRASAAPSPARCQDIYQNYAAALYRQALGIHPRDTAAPWRAVLRRLVTSRAAAVEDGDHVRGPAGGRGGHQR